MFADFRVRSIEETAFPHTTGMQEMEQVKAKM